MSEYAFYDYITNRASLEEIEACDNRDLWPDTFEGFMEWIGYSIQSHNPEYTDDIMLGMWKVGIWQEGFIHALAKQRRGDEETTIPLWWCKEYEETD